MSLTISVGCVGTKSLSLFHKTRGAKSPFRFLSNRGSLSWNLIQTKYGLMERALMAKMSRALKPQVHGRELEVNFNVGGQFLRGHVL